MLVVVADRDQRGTVEVNYSWLPTFIGMNSAVMKELENVMQEHAIGKLLTSETLLELHDKVIDFLETRFSHISGLRDYLDSLKFVEFVG